MPYGRTIYQKEFDFYWQTVANDFAYFDGERTRSRWSKVRLIYEPLAATIHNRNGLITLLEQANNELYNGHVTLNTNLPSSNRIIPTGADMWAEPERGEFVITNIRPGFNADTCGLRAGMVLKAFNGVPIRAAIQKFLPKSASHYSHAMNEYAVNMLLAGAHDTRRVIAVFSGGRKIVFHPDRLPNRTDSHGTALLHFSKLQGNIGYIKIDNSLDDVDLIQGFDAALHAFEGSRGIIVDMTECPSGGSSTVARGILGRFVSTERPYQQIAYPDEMRLYHVRRAQLDLVSPRAPVYTKPVVLLVNRWTGSMGEGVAIGFSAIGRAQIVGSRMAGLLGAVCSYETPTAKVGFSIPCQQTNEVTGAPRQDFVPRIGSGTPSDITIAKRLIRSSK